MREIGEQWIENGRMYKAVDGPKIVNGLMEGNTCHGCCYVDKWDDDCLNPNQAFPVGKGVIVKDLGPVNEDGCLAEERTLRDWFAGMVMQGLFSNPEVKRDYKLIVESSFVIADLMLKERNK